MRLTLQPLKQAFDAAIYKDEPILVRNPAKGVTLTRRMVKAKPRLKKKSLTKVEFGRYLNIIDGHKWGILLELLVTTGLRNGEARALKWSDIDFDTGLLTVQRSVSNQKIKGRYYFRGTKTGKVRDIKLDGELLEKFRERYERFREQNGNGKDGLIFTNDKGEVTSYRSILECHKKLCVKVGISTDITLHSLRHTCVTLLNASGV